MMDEAFGAEYAPAAWGGARHSAVSVNAENAFFDPRTGRASGFVLEADGGGVAEPGGFSGMRGGAPGAVALYAISRAWAPGRTGTQDRLLAAVSALGNHGCWPSRATAERLPATAPGAVTERHLQTVGAYTPRQRLGATETPAVVFLYLRYRLVAPLPAHATPSDAATILTAACHSAALAFIGRAATATLPTGTGRISLHLEGIVCAPPPPPSDGTRLDYLPRSPFVAFDCALRTGVDDEGGSGFVVVQDPVSDHVEVYSSERLDMATGEAEGDYVRRLCVAGCSTAVTGTVPFTAPRIFDYAYQPPADDVPRATGHAAMCTGRVRGSATATDAEGDLVAALSTATALAECVAGESGYFLEDLGVGLGGDGVYSVAPISFAPALAHLPQCAMSNPPRLLGLLGTGRCYTLHLYPHCLVNGPVVFDIPPPCLRAMYDIFAARKMPQHSVVVALDAPAVVAEIARIGAASGGTLLGASVQAEGALLAVPLRSLFPIDAGASGDDEAGWE